MNTRHLRTISILVAIMLLTGATEKFNNISFTDTKSTEIKTEDYYIKDIPLTKEQQRYVFEKSSEYNFDPFFIYAIMKKESSFNIECISESDDYGILQINKSNFKYIEKELGRDLKFLTFKDNVDAGLFMLDSYRTAWKGKYEDEPKKHMIFYLNSYNMGCKGYKKYVSSRGGKYNREYSTDILDYYRRFLLGDFSDIENN